MDGIKLRKALEKFAGDINRELAKDEEQDIPFLTLIGSKTSESTLFTCANELVRIGFVGVSAVRGGFKDQIHILNLMNIANLITDLTKKSI